MQKINRIITIGFLLLWSTLAIAQSQHETEFFDKYIGIAKDIENKYNVPVFLTLSVAALESGFGTSKAATERNNLFGIDKGKMQFQTVEHSFNYFGLLLSGRISDYTAKCYAPLWDSDNWREWCINFQNSKYTTSDTYAGKLIRIIIRNNLQEI